jgi:3'-5' exoribonuclease
MIISHHGQYDFGSPKLPMFAEALVLHYLDDLDSKMEAMRAHFEREIGADGPWTSYNGSLGRPLLDARKFEQGAKAAAKGGAEEPAASPSASGGTEATDVPAPAPDLFSEQKA